MADQGWAIAQYTTHSHPSARLGILVGDSVREAPPGFPETSAELFDRWREFEEVMRALDASDLRPLDAYALVAPLTFPRKLICAGANYLDHVREMGVDSVEPSGEPFFFLKPPTTAIVGPGAGVDLPRAEASDLDWEIELGVVIADRCKNVLAADAPRHVAGYVIANDLSARGLFARPGAIAEAFAWDWLSQKGPDGLCPIGPGIVPSWFVDDPATLGLRLDVNGVRKQDSSTSNLIVGIPGLIASASRYVTLEPGDIILTGTPAGVGMPRGEFLKSGDVIVAEIDGLGRLETRIN